MVCSGVFCSRGVGYSCGVLTHHRNFSHYIARAISQQMNGLAKQQNSLFVYLEILMLRIWQQY